MKKTIPAKTNKQRRRLLQSIAAAGIVLPLAPSSVLARKEQKFGNPLILPPLAEATRQGNQLSFNLSVAASQTEFFSGLKTPTLGINQSYLGPVLRAKQGDTVTINVTNKISEITTLHWHGMTLPANMDGGPHQEINPNQTWRSRFEIRQGAATLWYHSHAMHQTGPQVYQGLAGMFILDDKASESSDLPKDYGVDDIPCTIQDRRFNRDGSLSYMSQMPDHMMGMMGATMLVNGVVRPVLKAQKTLLRLRLHNGSNARSYQFAFSDGRPFYVIAADCGFLARPFKTKSIHLAAAERAEILLDVSDKKQFALISQATQSVAGMGMMRMMNNNNQRLDIMLIDARQAQPSKHRIPVSLPVASNPALDPGKAVTTRQFELEMGMMGRGGGGPMGMMRGMGGGMMGGNRQGGMFRINGKSMDKNRIDFQVKRNTTEIWEVSNVSPMAHPFHVHNVQFKVLDRNGKAPHPTETGLKDTVLVNPNEVVRIVMAFPEYSDATMPYMYHCHILEHEDQGMMGQFVVV